MQIIQPYVSPSDVASNTAARHTQNTDTKLNDGGANEVSAAQAKSAYSHVGSDGSSHADVVSNSTVRHTQGTDQGLDTGGENEVAVANVKDAVTKKHAQNTDTQLGTIAANINLGGNAITAGGPIAGGFNIKTISEDTVLSAEECLGYIIFVTGAYKVTIPAVSALTTGANIIIYASAAQIVTVAPNASDRIVLNGASLGDNHLVTSSGTAGDFVALIKDSAAGLTIIGRSGVWSDGGLPA